MINVFDIFNFYCFFTVIIFFIIYDFCIIFFLIDRGAKKDVPFSERKKSTTKFHAMKSPKYLPQKPHPQNKQLASQYKS